MQIYRSARPQNSRFFFLKISKEIGRRCEARAGDRETLLLSVFTLVPDLLFDCSRVLEYAKIRTVLQSIDLLTAAFPLIIITLRHIK